MTIIMYFSHSHNFDIDNIECAQSRHRVVHTTFKNYTYYIHTYNEICMLSDLHSCFKNEYLQNVHTYLWLLLTSFCTFLYALKHSNEISAFSFYWYW